jgi:nitrite reductase (NO-forming) / hydroxylamine reductase
MKKHFPFRHSKPLVIVAAIAFVFATAGCRDNGAAGHAPPSPEDIAAGERIFARDCISCHSVGQGDRIASDLKDIHERRDAGWLVRWMKDPMGMRTSDPIGREIFADPTKPPMPDPRLSDRQIRQVLAYIQDASQRAGDAPQATGPIELTEAQFATATQTYFDRCAGCHGALRVGATGPKIDEERGQALGQGALEAILTNGTPGGMPAFGREGLLSEDEIRWVSAFLQQPPPEPPPRPLEMIRESWNLMVPVAERPTEPQTTRDWQNYFGIILRDAGKVAIIDGDTKELAKIIDTGFAVHILRASHTGRYFYAVGRDGMVSMIDLWPEEPTLVAQIQGCSDSRSVESSKYPGYEDRLLLQGCYWPPQYVVMDGQTLEPKSVTDVTMPAYDTNEPLTEVRVAGMKASRQGPHWVVALKESGHVIIVDYSKPDFPISKVIPTERFLHDGGWDRTRRYFMVAANMRNQMVVIDTKTHEMVTKFETGRTPHPGRGANWEDPEYGWVNATPHLGEPKLAIYGADPEGSPEHAWKVVREIELPAPGGLFVKTHPNSSRVWVDSTLSNDPDETRQICVYSQAEGKLERCWQASDRGRVTHFEYNRQGTEVWVSVWDREGELIVYDDATLEEITRIRGDWLVTPTGKFNVFNTSGDVY